MVVSLAFVNGFHYWPVIKQFPQCLTSTPLFAWLGFIPFLGDSDWIPWVDSSIIIFAIAQDAQDLVTLYMTFCWDIDPPCILVAMIDCWAWINLVHLWPWLLYIWYGAFCILSDHDSFINYTYVGSAYIFMAMICIWTCMSQRSFLSDIYLSFKYLYSSLSILDSMLSPYSSFSFIMYIGYSLPL